MVFSPALAAATSSSVSNFSCPGLLGSSVISEFYSFAKYHLRRKLLCIRNPAASENFVMSRCHFKVSYFPTFK